MNSLRVVIIVVLLFCGLLALAASAVAKSGIVGTRHNLSTSGPGELRALTETRICVFCHTPHNAAPATPLWNKKLDAVTYVTYGSSTMGAKPSQPTGPSRLCLSCHDGTVALGAVLRPAEGISMTVEGGIPPARSSHLGTALSDDHPVSFAYHDSLPNSELSPVLPPGLLFYGGMMHCSTCHDAHDNSNKKFLAVDNANSGLCTLCHLTEGWSGASHRNSQSIWNGGLPNPWPRTGEGTDFNWTTVQQNGCEGCHAPHTAGGPQRLMNALAEEDNCFPCHNGNVATLNVQAQFLKPSRHPVDFTTIGITPAHHEPNENPTLLGKHVECADCHNAHASNSRTAAAPAVSGKLEKVSGVTISGSGIVPPAYAAYEYEVCFKCHADSSSVYPLVPRVINTVNTRLEFAADNPSYHPVAAIGRNSDVPSIPSSYEPGMTASTIIYCTDCHDSDASASVDGTGPRGPHGSLYAPLLRQRYETNDRTPENSDNYALCYRCHNRDSILLDESFRKNGTLGGHSGHLGPAVNAPCSACHDPHGIDDNGLSGSHTHLINFDTRIVSASGANAFPLFSDLGSRSGSCTLVCHGREHTGVPTYQY